MAKFSTAFKMKLHERVNGKNKEVGEAMIPCPVLTDFGITAEQAKDAKGSPIVENGIPTYADPRLAFLQDAVVSIMSIRSRGKFDGGKLKPNMNLPEDFDALFEATGNQGEALVIRREARTSFETYLQGLKKKAATVQLLSDVFQNSAKVLGASSTNVVEALAAHCKNWTDTLTEEQKARFRPKIAELEESINNALGGVDLEDMAA